MSDNNSNCECECPIRCRWIRSQLYRVSSPDVKTNENQINTHYLKSLLRDQNDENNKKYRRDKYYS